MSKVALPFPLLFCFESLFERIFFSKTIFMYKMAEKKHDCENEVSNVVRSLKKQRRSSVR